MNRQWDSTDGTRTNPHTAEINGTDGTQTSACNVEPRDLLSAINRLNGKTCTLPPTAPEGMSPEETALLGGTGQLPGDDMV